MEKVVIVSGGAIEDEFAREYIEKIVPDTLLRQTPGCSFFSGLELLPIM